MYYLLGAGRFPSSRYSKFYHISLLLCTWQQMFSPSPGHITPLSSVGWWKKHFVLYPHNSPCPWCIQNSWVLQRETLCSCALKHLLCKRISSVTLFCKPLGGMDLTHPTSIWLMTRVWITGVSEGLTPLLDSRYEGKLINNLRISAWLQMLHLFNTTV